VALDGLGPCFADRGCVVGEKGNLLNPDELVERLRRHPDGQRLRLVDEAASLAGEVAGRPAGAVNVADNFERLAHALERGSGELLVAMDGGKCKYGLCLGRNEADKLRDNERARPRLFRTGRGGSNP
jgi:hypothetical protein